MKRCPQCNRTYADDALSFCLDDGSPLLSTGGPAPSDPSATVQYPQARDTSGQATIAFNPAPQPPPPPLPTPPPAWNPMPPSIPPKRSAWPWVLGIGAVLVFMGIGVVILIFAVTRITNDNNNNNNNKGNSNNSNKVANRNTNKNTNSDETNTNSNSRSNLTTFTDDFSSKTWGTGESQFGNLWYQDEEYHMHAVKKGFLVMYAPDKPEYHDESATVRIGLRSIDGNPPSAGYGLVVHGEKTKDGKLEDYGFLIYNGDNNPKYKVVLHKGGDETKVADWTPSGTIRTGTSPNQLEVRIRDVKMDFYINGQFVTSITDDAGYKRGRVGLYTSDVGEVAFDDLEISK